MKPPFPSIYSTLCPTALSALISEKYVLEHVQTQFLVRGVGDTYLITSASERFILRVYRSSHRSLPQVQEEVALLLALKEAGVSISYPIPDMHGEPIQELDAAEGKRYAVLFSYAPGHSIKKLSDNQLRALGLEMAKFHELSSTIRPGGARWNFDFETTIFKPLTLLQPFFLEDPESHSWLEQAAEQAVNKLSQLDTSGFSIGYCHFDFLPKNFHFEGDSVTFFDFDFMGYGWLANDITSFWQHLILDVYTKRMTQDEFDNALSVFLNAYRAYRPFSEQELAAVPYLGLGFWLFYMAFHTTHDQFYSFVQPAHLKGVTTFLKHMVETYWENPASLDEL